MDSITKANFTPLTDAVAKGDHASVLFLLETGADPEERDNTGRSALSIAVSNRNTKTAAYLLEFGARPDSVDGSGKSPIQVASEAKDAAIIGILSGAAAEVPKAPSPKAARKPHHVRRKTRWSMLRTAFLYVFGAGVAIGAYEMRVMFHLRASQDVFDAIAANNVPAVSRMLINGISPDIKDPYGTSALLGAANYGRTDIVRLLLKNHADPNLSTPAGISAIKRTGLEHVEIVEALLQSGAKPNQQDSRGRTLLAYACASDSYPNLIIMLLRHNANPNVVGENGPPLVSLIECGENTSEVAVRALLNAGADANATDSGSTPVLTWAAERASPAIVKLLLEHGASTSAMDYLKRTALEAACHDERPEIVQLLLERGADPNVADADGNSAVMYAVAGMLDGAVELDNSCTQILKMLAKHGARMNRTNHAGQTPLQFASERGVDVPGMRTVLEQ